MLMMLSAFAIAVERVVRGLADNRVINTVKYYDEYSILRHCTIVNRLIALLRYKAKEAACCRRTPAQLCHRNDTLPSIDSVNLRATTVNCP